VDTVPQSEESAAVPDGKREPDVDAPAVPAGVPVPDDIIDPDGFPLREDHSPHEPLPFQRWIKRSASGAVLTGIAFGLQEVLQPKRELPAFVMEATGEPEDPNAPISLHFDPDDPTKTVAVIRTPPSEATSDRTPDPGV